MSRTKRGGDPLGRYDTPAWATHQMLDVIGPIVPRDKGVWLEPCAGNGSIVRAAMEHPAYSGQDVDMIDIAPRGDLAPLMIDEDFRSWFDRNSQVYSLAWDFCPSNPPFRLAFEFARRVVPVCAVTSLLLRLNWLEGGERREPERGAFLDRTRPDVFVLPHRPRFLRDGQPIEDEDGNIKKSSDATAYAWFVWHKDSTGSWYRLPSVPVEKRKT